MNPLIKSIRTGFIACAFFSASTFAAELVDSGSDLFSISITVDTTTKIFSFNTVENLFDSIDEATLKAEFAGYDKDVDSVGTSINYRGVAFNIAYGANSNDLTLNIPELNISETFTGASRDASNDLLSDYFEGNDDLVNKLNKLLSTTSATDPIAGNPSSLMGNMVDTAFSTSASTTSETSTSSSGPTAAKESGGSVFATGIHFGRFRQDGKDVTSYNIPLKFEYRTESNTQVFISIPFTFVEVNRAASYKLAVDFAVKMPIDEQWSLTPGVGYGLVASEDLASAGQIGSVSIASLYTLDKSVIGGKDWAVSIANFVGLYKTIPIKLNNVNVDPDISNTVSKNGIIANSKTEIFGSKANVQTYFTDTRFFGDELYTNHYNEIGFYITPIDKSGYKRYMQVNISYLFGNNDISGVNASLSYSF